MLKESTNNNVTKKNRTGSAEGETTTPGETIRCY